MREVLSNMAFAVLLALVRTEEAKRVYRRAFLKVFRVVREVFRGDEEFEAIAKSEPL